jgi:UDP-N-acetylmuramyl pentapeptide synthase
MKDREIRSAIFELRPIKKTMEPFKNNKGVVLVDDTYNANPKSVESAVLYTKLYKGKKVLVLQPMIELGENASKRHYEVGILIGEICDYLFLTNDNFYEEILQGIKESRGKCKVFVLSPVKIKDFVEEHFRRGDVVVFEGKEAANALGLIAKEKII